MDERARGEAASQPATLERWLPVAEYSVRLRVEEPVELKGYLGSALNGALGRAMCNEACPFERKPVCIGCELREDCLYPVHFRPVSEHSRRGRDLPGPFGLRPDWQEGTRRYRPGDEIAFMFVLYGDAREHEAIYLDAIERMARRGLGKGRARMSLTEFARCERVSSRAASPPLSGRLRVELQTPLWLRLPKHLQATRRRKHATAVDLSGTLFLEALLTRCLDLLECHGHGIPDEEIVAEMRVAAARVGTLDVHIKPRDTCRKASSDGEMLIGGLLGSFVLADVPSLLSPWLELASRVGVGKLTSMGFGRVRIVPMEPDRLKCEDRQRPARLPLVRDMDRCPEPDHEG